MLTAVLLLLVLLGSGPPDAAHCPLQAGHGTTTATALAEPGQAIFGALREVTDRLEREPPADWSRVSLDRLREHLLQMDRLFREAEVETVAVEDGARFLVRGGPAVLDAARTMGRAHMPLLEGDLLASSSVRDLDPETVEIRVAAAAAELPRLRALGLFGLLSLGGDHHGIHHWRMATGDAGHGSMHH